MKVSLISLIFLLLFSLPGSAQVKSTAGAEAINWISIEQLPDLAKADQKKVMVKVFTSYCGWCKKMDRETLQNPYIAQYINEHFYAVKLNAEQEEEIVFKDKKYRFVPLTPPSRGYHELAAALMRGQLSYPTIVFLDENLELIQPIQGYKDPQMFEAIITYFGQDFHKKLPWNRFKESFKSVMVQRALQVKE